MMIIEATQVTTTEAVPARTYDKWAITRCLFDGEQFPLLRGSVEVKRYCSDDYVLEPGQPQVLTFDDLFLLAETDPDIAAWIDLTNKIVKAKMDAEGVR